MAVGAGILPDPPRSDQFPMTVGSHVQVGSAITDFFCGVPCPCAADRPAVVFGIVLRLPLVAGKALQRRAFGPPWRRRRRPTQGIAVAIKRRATPGFRIVECERPGQDAIPVAEDILEGACAVAVTLVAFAA